MKKNPFTLLELSVVMLIIVSLASFMVSQGLPIVEQSIERQYQKNVKASVTGIVGDNSIRDFDGSVVPFGYLNDVGSFPEDIEDLWEKPDLIPEYTKHTFTVNGVSSYLFGGWNGPYFDPVNENLKNNLRLERDDYPEIGPDADLIDDDDDVKLFALGYSDAAIFEYGEENFRKRTIEIKGIPPEFTAKVTIYHIVDGILVDPPIEQNIPGSDDTVELPKGICAFYAEFIPTNTVVAVQVGPSPEPDDVGEKVRVEESGTSGIFIGKENQIATWDGSSYSFSAPAPMDTLHNESDNKYYIYSLDEDGITLSWKEQIVTGTKTPRVIKTLKTDILLELE